MVIEERAVHPLNAEDPMVSTESGMEIDVREVQSQKMKDLRVRIVSGMVIDPR